ncbi:hypothetical protein FE784_26690 [Paenibacillus hemerocallicola]|uniref:Uncharacterized protein n=1 Tax=Paenibacillus hemerocallicola TaxID=1172614 RepID=A0A5C4T2G4_9BACL|nr:glycosyl hydrolase family 18 protein [Paenibacillus hemerocallicola]TNJ63251.1 hypothetical protein FE784_26690 [Paenibacillus hemerocallicola]
MIKRKSAMLFMLVALLSSLFTLTAYGQEQTDAQTMTDTGQGGSVEWTVKRTEELIWKQTEEITYKASVVGGTGSGGDKPGVARQANNTAYLNSYWFSGVEPLTDAQMKQRVLELQKYKIKYQLADIGILANSNDAYNGTLPEEGYAQLGRWMKLSRETDPGQKIIATVNYGQRYFWQNGQRVSNPNFGNAVFNDNLRAFADKIVNQGVLYEGKWYKADGIQLDIEGFLPNDPVLMATAQHVRGALNETAIYSIASPADPAVWSDAYVTEMAGIFNMLNPMMYDQMGWGSPVVSAETYQQLWKSTIIRYAHAIANSSRPTTMLNPTMPAYEKKVAEDGTVYHDPAVENIVNAAKGLKMAREQLAIDRGSDPRIVKNGVNGAGIFWWSKFILVGPDPNDPYGHDYAPDREWWMKEWVGQK